MLCTIGAPTISANSMEGEAALIEPLPVTAAAAVAAVTGKGSIKAASPSKLFAEIVGAPIVQSIVKDNESQQAALNNAMSKMVNPSLVNKSGFGSYGLGGNV